MSSATQSSVPPPQFTRDERWIISTYLRRRSANLLDWLVPELGFIIPTMAVAAWGWTEDSARLIGLAFLMLLAFHVVTQFQSSRYMSPASRAIEKLATYLDAVAKTQLVGDPPQGAEQASSQSPPVLGT